MFALTTTFPVGEFTVIPAPAVLLTEYTSWSLLENNSVKFSCTFSNAVLIASELGSSGKLPKLMFFCARVNSFQL